MGDLLQVVKLPPVMKIPKKFTLPLGKASYQTPNCRALHAALTNPSLLFQQSEVHTLFWSLVLIAQNEFDVVCLILPSVILALRIRKKSGLNFFYYKICA